MDKAASRLGAGLVLLDFLPRLIFSDISLLLFPSPTILEPVLNVSQHKTSCHLRGCKTDVDTRIVHPHRLSKGFLNGTVWLVVLLELSLQDLHLLLGETWLRLGRARHLLMVNEVMMIRLICVHGVAKKRRVGRVLWVCREGIMGLLVSP